MKYIGKNRKWGILISIYGLYIIAHQIPYPYIKICADTHCISYISSPL